MLKQKLIISLIAAAFAVPAFAQAPKADDKKAPAATTTKKADTKATADKPAKKKKGKAKAKKDAK